MNRIHFNRAKTLVSHIVLAMGITVLVACGGGGGGSSKSNSSSVSTSSLMSSSSSSMSLKASPVEFSFTSQNDVKRGETIISNTVTVAGIDAVYTVSITNGEYAIGDTDEFVTTAGTITVGETIKVRVTAPSGFDETQAAELNVGGVKATFSVTTEKQDTEPKAFNFNPVTDAKFESEHVSGEITVEEINDTAEISITNGFYSVNNREFTDAVGTVDLTDKVKVKGIAASKTDTTNDVTLTIGGVPGVFSITTFSDTVAPTAEIAFPPPTSKTENNSVIVRGTVEDDYNEIDSIKLYVNGNESVSEMVIETIEGAVSWRTQIDLPLSENVIKVAVEDSQGNLNAEAASVSVYKGDLDSAFPQEGNDFGDVYDLAVYNTDSGFKVLSPSYSNGPIISMDLNTGEREAVEVSSVPEGLNTFSNIEVDIAKNLLFLLHPSVSGGDQAILAVDMTTWAVANSYILNSSMIGTAFGLAIDLSQSEPRLLHGSWQDNIVGSISYKLDAYEVLSSNSKPNADYLFNYPREFAIHPDTKRIFVINGWSQDIYEINPETGERIVISSVDDASNEAKDWDMSTSVAIDVNEGRNRLLVTAEDRQSLLSVDLDTGERTLFSNGEQMMFENLSGIKIHPELGYALTYDKNKFAIFAIDLFSGQSVVVTKSK